MNLNAAMESVIRYAIAESLPEAAVRKALADCSAGAFLRLELRRK